MPNTIPPNFDTEIEDTAQEKQLRDLLAQIITLSAKTLKCKVTGCAVDLTILPQERFDALYQDCPGAIKNIELGDGKERPGVVVGGSIKKGENEKAWELSVMVDTD